MHSTQRFVEYMKPFSVDARLNLNEIKKILQEMEARYTELEVYYVFDKKRYPIDDFLSDIKLFRDQFKVLITLQYIVPN